ncbi:MAG: hypothetical protein DBY14_02160 [Escherichia coli]|nr:MAG: hypothetical protein DBY14_02160 [Escherichia coli]
MNKKKIFKISSVVVFSVLIVSLIVSVSVFLFQQHQILKSFAKKTPLKIQKNLSFTKQTKPKTIFLFCQPTTDNQKSRNFLFFVKKISV